MVGATTSVVPGIGGATVIPSVGGTGVGGTFVRTATVGLDVGVAVNVLVGVPVATRKRSAWPQGAVFPAPRGLRALES